MIDKPNILLIMTDQQRYDSLGYSSHNGTSDTPHLDNLASMGVIFDHAYSSDTACIPSRSSLMTGLLPHRVPTGGFRPRARTTSGQALREGYWTIGHALRDVGYQTALFGKMHFSPIRAQHGFDIMQTCEHLPAGYDSKACDDYRNWIISTGRKDQRFVKPSIPKIFPYEADAHPTAWIKRHAIDFLQNRDCTQPSFTIVSFTDPHTPYSPPQHYASLYKPEDQLLPTSTIDSNLGLPWPFSDITQRHPPGTFFTPARVDEHSQQHLRCVLAAIRAGLRHVDDAVGELLQHVDFSNTVLIFLSDHGDYGGHRGFLGKIPWIPFDDVARVPFFMAGAGIKGGRRVPEPVQSFDYVATVLEMAGVPAPTADMESQSLAAILAGGQADADRAIFSSTIEGAPMLRRGHFKDIWHSVADVHILYDLEADPGETHNLAADPQYRTMLEETTRTLQSMLMRPIPDLWRGTTS